MKRIHYSPHLFFTLILITGLLFGAFGQTLVSALGVNNGIPGEKNAATTPVSFKLQYPSISPTNADTLTFRVTFSGAVTGVDIADFKVHDNTPDPTTSAPVLTALQISTSIYAVSIWGGDLDSFNGVVGLDFSTTAVILDASDNPISIIEPATDETYLIDNSRPTVTVTQAVGQSDPATTQPILFNVVFSEAMNVATFETQDILQGGTANISQSIITDLGDHKNFRLTVLVTENGVILPSLPANTVFDLAGNGNEAFPGGCATPEPNNCITLVDTFPPTVTIEQYPTQPDPATELPVRFTITFSEPIIPGDFTTAVIRQLGTAGKIVWNIEDTGSHREFILSAAESTYGTLIPFIPAGTVRDLVGLYNRGSTSTDGTVLYTQLPTPTPMPTPPQVPFRSVVISEVAWMGTAASSSDEWIELVNTTDQPIDMRGWKLRSFRWSGTPATGHWDLNLNVTFTSSDILPARSSIDPTLGYYLLERGDENTVKGIKADKIYTGTLLNDTGEILLLCSGQNIVAGICTIDNKDRLVDYVNTNWFGSGSNNTWPAGKGAPLFGSMERQDLMSDEDGVWFTHTTASPRYGHDRNWDGVTAGKNLLNATPRHPNWAFNVTATPTYKPPTSSYTAASIGTYDGWILESSEDSNKGEVLDSTSSTLRLGDSAQDKQYRAILHFDTSSLPNNALITYAALKITLSHGTIPFGVFGSIKVDMRIPYFGPSQLLNSRDFQETAGISTVASFSTVGTDLTSIAVLSPTGRAYINLLGPTQFRLFFGKGDNDNNTANYLLFYSGNSLTASYKPTLIIEYYVP